MVIAEIGALNPHGIYTSGAVNGVSSEGVCCALLCVGRLLLSIELSARPGLSGQPESPGPGGSTDCFRVPARTR